MPPALAIDVSASSQVPRPHLPAEEVLFLPHIQIVVKMPARHTFLKNHNYDDDNYNVIIVIIILSVFAHIPFFLDIKTAEPTSLPLWHILTVTLQRSGKKLYGVKLYADFIYPKWAKLVRTKIGGRVRSFVFRLPYS